MDEIKGYVTKSVLSTLGLSLYILADTFFIANGVGVLGLAALNIALPLFNLLTGIGLLLGMGGATLFALKGRSVNYFSQLVIVGGVIGLLFTALGLFFGRPFALALGASGATVDLTTLYMRFILTMAPFFILNNLCLAFVRNDQNPQLAMKAMLLSSFFNIIFDYIFIFPLDMGMAGAALATVLSPVLSLAILSTHRNFSKRQLSLSWVKPQLKTVTKSIQLAAYGIPIFFVSLFGSSLNVVFSIFFSAIGHAKQAFALSLFRGYFLLVPLVIILAALWGLTGAWISLPITEGLTLFVSFFFLRKYQKAAINASKLNVEA